MEFVITLLAVTVFACVLRNPLRRVPWLFYGLAVVFVVAYLASTTLSLPRPVSHALMLLMNRCLLPTAIFVVVMYVGVFPKGSGARRWLQPLRTPLSIVGCILVLGHMVRFIGAYAARVFGGAGVVAPNVLVSFGLAVALFALLAVLGVTSFNAVRAHMKGATWRRVQRWAYLFYGLVYAHVLVMLGPAALNGGAAAREAVAVYTAVFGAYAVLRVARAILDRRQGSEACPTERRGGTEDVLAVAE